MTRSIQPFISGSLAILLSAGMFLSTLQIHERGSAHLHDDPVQQHQIVDSHIFCPICMAVFTCCSADATASISLYLNEELATPLARQNIPGRIYFDKYGRAPPLSA